MFSTALETTKFLLERTPYTGLSSRLGTAGLRRCRCVCVCTARRTAAARVAVSGEARRMAMVRAMGRGADAPGGGSAYGMPGLAVGLFLKLLGSGRSDSRGGPMVAVPDRFLCRITASVDSLPRLAPRTFVVLGRTNVDPVGGCRGSKRDRCRSRFGGGGSSCSIQW